MFHNRVPPLKKSRQNGGHFVAAVNASRNRAASLIVDRVVKLDQDARIIMSVCLHFVTVMNYAKATDKSIQ